jgi:hypothetical protein
MAKDKGLGKLTSALEAASKAADGFKQSVMGMETNAIEIAKQFGQGRENIVNIKIGLAEASDSLVKVGVNIKEAINEAGKIQKTFSESIGRNALLTSESFGQIKAMTDVSGQSVKQLTEGFADAGISIVNSGKEMQKVVDTSRSIGVDTQAVSAMVVKNLATTAQFNFQGGVEGMAKMAAQAVNLRVDMSKTLDLADKLFNPEAAIDMAAAMQRLGVAQSSLLDPLKLMDMAQNDPAELQNQIAEMSKEFVRLNEKGQFEIMPGAKRQLKEIGEQLGMRNGELVKMALAGAELDDKLSKIKLPDTFSEEQKQFIANMATMGPGGEYKLKVDGEDIGLEKAISLFSQDKGKLDKFMEAQAPKTMEELAKEQINIFTSMANDLEYLQSIDTRLGIVIGSTKTAESMLTAGKELSSELPKIFGEEELSTKQLRKKTDEGLKGVTGALAEGDIMGAGKQLLDNIGGFLTSSFEGVTKRGESAVKEIGESKNEAIQAVKGVVGTGLEGLEKVTGIDLKGKELIESNKKLQEATVKPTTTETKKELNETTKSEPSSTKTELSYNGKIDVNVNLPTGLSDNEFKNLISKLTTDNEFREKLKVELLNIKGTESPTDINKKLNSEYKQ